MTVQQLIEEIEPTATEQQPIFVETYARVALVVQTRKGERIEQWYDSCLNEVEREVPAGARQSLGNQKTLCNKKCSQGQCPTCGYVKTNKRWLARIILMDHTDKVWVQGFDAEMKTLTGMTAEEASKLSEDALSAMYERLVQAKLWKLR